MLVAAVALLLVAHQPADSAARAGIAAFESRRFDDAYRILMPLASAKTAPAEVLFLAGRLALRAREYGSAVGLLERAVRIDGRSSTYALWLGRAYAQDAVNGNKLRLVFVAKRSKNEYERAVALDPDNIDARMDLGQYYLLAPGIAGGSQERAAEQVREIARRSAYHGHLAAGAVAIVRKDTALAEREYRAARAAAPDSMDGVAALTQLLSARGRYDEARAAIQTLTSKHPNEPLPRYMLGVLAAQSKQHLDEGEAGLQAYLAGLPRENDPAPSAAHYWLGAVYRAQGKNADARAAFEESLRLNPRSARAKRALDELRRG